MKYAGLTDDQKKIKAELENPADFKVMQQFTSEFSAKLWEKRMFAQGYEKDKKGIGWKYGYTFSVRH
jgi:hypothetical protein